MNNQAIDYFPMNVDIFDDDKIALVEGEFGEKGGYLAIRLLCKIFGTGGYYYQWGEDERLLLTKKLGTGFVPNLVQEIVLGLVRRGFFDEAVFDSFNCLTSRGIQNRYFEAVRKRRRVEVRPELLLVDVSKFKNVVILGEKVDISSKKGGNSAQSKVKESKETSPSFSSPSGEADEKGAGDGEKEKIIYKFFFERNFLSPVYEYGRLVEFNNEPGKKGWKGLSAGRKKDFADSWTPLNNTSRFKENFLSCWKTVYKKLCEHGASEEVRLAALSDRLKVYSGGDYLYICCDECLHDFMETPAVLDDIKPVLWKYITACGCRGLRYFTEDQKNDEQ